MTAKQILQELKTLGTAQNRKVWSRHGAPPSYLGVSFGQLDKIKRRIMREYKKDPAGRHQLAMELWDTAVCDAQILAAMVADPAQVTKRAAKAMIRPCDFFLVSNYLGGLFARCDFAVALMEEEMRSRREYIRHNGYDILATILKNGTPRLTKRQCLTYLSTIEAQIHQSPNRARSAMNAALIAMGTYRDDVHQRVITVARRIGPVEVDHGDTSCKTPDALGYIEKSRRHLKKTK